MIPSDFQDYFRNSSALVQEEMINELLHLSNFGNCLEENVDLQVISCPHCSSKKIRANGKLKGVQRYYCNNCQKNFSQNTGKFWYHIKKKDKVKDYLYCLLSGYSIRKSAKEVGISIQTSFTWRHKLLTSFSSVSVSEFEGIVESDDLFFTHSEKGNKNLDRAPRKRGSKASKAGISDQKVAVIATCDRQGNKDFKVSTRGRISKKDIEKTLAGKLDKVQVLCSDSHRSYSAFAKGKDFEHKQFNASKGQKAVDKIYHVQNVNNLDMRLRKFMESFNGVATKYLQNYLNWFLVLEKIKNATNRMAIVTAIAFASNDVWEQFNNISNQYVF